MRMIGSFIVITFMVAACGRIPEPIGFDYSQQKKMQASHHWDVLAADIANQLNNELIINDYLDTPVFVRKTCGDENSVCKPEESTVFEESFRDLLITNLVTLGVPTTPHLSDKAIVVNFKAQPVYHNRNRWRTLKPGLLTALTAGILVIRNAPSELVTLAIAGTIDFANAAYVNPSNFEVIITTSVIAKHQYLFRNSNIYYINDQDSWHYMIPAEPAEISLTASLPDTPEDIIEPNQQDLPVPRLPYPSPSPSDATGI